MKEQEKKSGREIWGRRVVYGGIVAGLIGLVVSPELMIAGIGVAAGGIIFERSGKNTKTQFQAA
jgi:hypothetical protein